MDELLNDFLAETSEHLESASTQLVMFESDPSNSAIVSSIFRLVHTIKGTCGFLGLTRLEALTHAAEAVISRLRDGRAATPEMVSLILAAVDRVKIILAEIEAHAAEPPGDDAALIGELEAQLESLEAFDHAEAGLAVAGPADDPGAAPRPANAAPSASAAAAGSDRLKRSETIRVDVSSLERIMVLVSELVLTRNQLLEINRKQEDEAVKAPMQRLSSLTSDLQDSVMRARMQPLSRLFARLPRLVRELAVETRKKLALVVDGGDTELDRQLIEVVRDPLTHILRNAADHGIELPADRIMAGKPEHGTIRISASHEAGYISVSIADDGRGLDVERIKAKALARGLVGLADLDDLPPEQVYRFIFLPEFSTAAKVTSISGRGVGLDVVRENIETIGGSIAVTSTFGKGTSFNLKIPLTLAIAPALIVETGHQRYALPQQSVVEAIGFGQGSPHRVERVQGAMVLRLRDKVIPLVDLRDTFKLPHEADAQSKLAVVMRFGAHLFAVLVDHVADVQEIVVKPLGASLAHLFMFSGHTILGDGSVVLILDPVGLARSIGLTQTLELGVEHVPERFVPPAREDAPGAVPRRRRRPQGRAVVAHLAHRVRHRRHRRLRRHAGDAAPRLPHAAADARRAHLARRSRQPSDPGARHRRRERRPGGRRDPRHRRGLPRHRDRQRRAGRGGLGPPRRHGGRGHRHLAFRQHGAARRAGPRHRQPLLRAARRRPAVLPRHAGAAARRRRLPRDDRQFGAPTRCSCCRAARCSTPSSPTPTCRTWTATR